MTLHVLAEADAEIESARQYLESQRGGLGASFLDDLTEALAAIADRPLSFAKIETLPKKQPYRRSLLKAFPYVVVFEVIGEEIVVLAVAHSSRAANYWLGRRM